MNNTYRTQTKRIIKALSITVLTVSIIVSSIFSILLIAKEAQGALRFNVWINSRAFFPGDIIVLYGKGIPDDALLVRLFDPSDKVVRLENIKIDEDGLFTIQFFTWPSPSKNFPFGGYTVEVLSSIVPSDRERFFISFFEQLDLSGQQQTRLPVLTAKLDSPTQVPTGTIFRIFVQVTYDGALIPTDPEIEKELLGSSHIHAGNFTLNLSDKFVKLHEGLYYADVTLDEEGSYVIHAIAFHKGLLAHDSKVVSASASSIQSIQESVTGLKEELERSSHELTSSVADARASIKEDVSRVSDASGQINALILPVLALISVIIALQISLFARIRASYR